MRVFQFCAVGCVAVDIARACGAGFGLREDGIRLCFVLARDCDGQHFVLRKVAFDRRVGQQRVQRVGVVEETDVERFGERFAVVPNAFYRYNLIKPVDTQLDRGVDVNADGAGRGEVRPVARPACNHQRQTGKGGCKAARRVPARLGRAKVTGLAGEERAGGLTQRVVCRDLIQCGFQFVTHRHPLPAFRAAPVWRG